MKGYIMVSKTKLIPYASDGSIPWEHPWSEFRYDIRTDDYTLKPDTKYDWREAESFRAQLRFHQWKPIRSGATIRMQNNDTGAIYPMKSEEFIKLIPELKFGLTPVAYWEPYRVGSNYNIRRVNTG